VREWAAAAPFDVEILPCEPASGQRAIEALQVSTRSPLGALALHSGGLLIDRGWLRVLGAGCPRLPRAIDMWNALADAEHRCAEGLLVGDDAVGGFFAIFSEQRTVHYLAPDTLQWDDLCCGHTEWLAAMLTDGLTKFYAELRWPGWQDEVRALDGLKTFSVMPPLWAKGPPIGERSRRAVPVQDVWAMALDVGRQLAGAPDGEEFEFKIVE